MTKQDQLYKKPKPRKKKCKHCKTFFTPEREMQSCCSVYCSLEYAKKPDNLKRYMNAHKRELRAKNVSKSDLKAKAQKVVNEYVRLRDSKLPCISCGHVEGRQFHAGHFRPMGNNQHLRYYTLNIWKQCSICNNYKSGNLVPYRKNLIAKLGLEKVEEIEANQEIKKYSIEYLERLIVVFRKKIKLYKKRR